jgi:CBS domain-containing protein
MPSILAKDLMTSPAVTITPEATLKEAAQLMLGEKVHCLPVLDRAQRLVGIITDTDFSVHSGRPLTRNSNLYLVLGHLTSGGEIEGEFRNSSIRKISDVMNRTVDSVHQEATIEEIATTMLRHQVHHLPVVSDDKVIGIITPFDLMKLVVSNRG